MFTELGRQKFDVGAILIARATILYNTKYQTQKGETMKDLSNENIIQKEKNGITYLQFRKLLEFPEIKHMYVLKNGNLSFKRKDESTEAIESLKDNYDVVCKLENMDSNRVIRPTQQHTDCIKEVDEYFLEKGPAIYLDELDNVDGVMTNKKNIVLSTTNADCLLLLFYDPKRKVIANIHSGWKGTFQKISLKAVKEMQEVYGSNPSDLLCFMTPCIRKCCFEVREDVKLLCEEKFAYTNKLDCFIKDIGVVDGEQKYTIDNVAINYVLLEEAGVKGENIFDSNICSLCEKEQIHSRRAEGPEYGVGTVLISLV